MQDQKKEITKYDFSNKKTYVLNYDNKEWVFIKVKEVKESFLIGDCVFSKQDKIYPSGSCIIEIRLIVDFREATGMENYLFFHHYNAVNYKRFVMNRLNDSIKDVRNSEEVVRESKKLKTYLDI